jgi:hypothetical protein
VLPADRNLSTYFFNLPYDFASGVGGFVFMLTRPAFTSTMRPMRAAMGARKMSIAEMTITGIDSDKGKLGIAEGIACLVRVCRVLADVE